MSKRSPDLLIQGIIESAQKILEYTKGLTYDEFKSDCYFNTSLLITSF